MTDDDREDHCILIRLSNGRIVSMTSEDDYIVTYPSEDEAI